MKCVICEEKVSVVDSRHSKHFITTRTYQCPKCKLKFKTKEQVIFESVPFHIRHHFIKTGERKNVRNDLWW